MKKIRNLMEICGKMKELRRSGWVYHKVETPETDAAHSWGLSLLVQLYASDDLDLCKCLKMANIHDLAEVYVGDIMPGDYYPEVKISPEEKHRREIAAMQKLAEELGTPELLDLLNEFEEQKTPEAVFVRNMDRLDAVIQAGYYDRTQNYGGRLFEEFYNYAETKITHPVVLELLKELKD